MTSLPDLPLAHVAPGGRAHGLRAHLEAVAREARVFGDKFGSGAEAATAGILHDLGKFGGEFQKRIREANGYSAEHLEPPDLLVRDHSTAGAIRAAAMGQVGTLLAFAIAGHHAGMPNLGDLRERLASPLKRRLCEDAMRRGGSEVAAAAPAAPPWLRAAGDPLAYEMWVRMIFSALVDADRLDAEAFLSPEKEREVPWTPAQLLGVLEAHLAGLGQSRNARVGELRQLVRGACREAAGGPQGAFSLTAPTGSGKTLSFLLFALRHAVCHGLSRVVVVLPYLSLIEQVVDELRWVFASMPDAVVEHHSAVDPRKDTPLNILACENWDAPLVVTTTVQFFESLLSNRPGACRKLHNLARSVVVLDEAQVLPTGILRPALSAVGELVRSYGTTLLLSTATQPAIGRGSFADAEMGLDLAEVVPAEARRPLRRYVVRWPADLDAPTSYLDLAREAAGEPDALLVTHTRRDARELAEWIDDITGRRDTYHLSAAMHPAHRSRTIAEIRLRKGGGQPVRLVSTQLIESGTDLSFRVAYRALGGLDSMAQCAGRCNREGDPDPGELRVFLAPTPPPPGVLTRALEVARGMLAEGPVDLEDPDTFARYFRRLYATSNEDSRGIDAARRALRFRDTASRFRVIEDHAWEMPVIVPEGDALGAVEQARTSGPDRRCLRTIQRYTVLAPRKQVDAWLAEGLAEVVADTFVVLADPTLYDERFGLVAD